MTLEARPIEDLVDREDLPRIHEGLRWPGRREEIADIHCDRALHVAPPLMFGASRWKIKAAGQCPSLSCGACTWAAARLRSAVNDPKTEPPATTRAPQAEEARWRTRSRRGRPTSPPSSRLGEGAWQQTHSRRPQKPAALVDPSLPRSRSTGPPETREVHRSALPVRVSAPCGASGRHGAFRRQPARARASSRARVPPR